MHQAFPALPNARRSCWKTLAGPLVMGAGLCASGPLWAATLTVQPGQSIRQAMNGASCGDTIEVHAGTYNESINAYHVCPPDNRIRVVGLPGPRPLITPNPLEYAISFSGAGATFEHLELTSAPGCDVNNRVVFGNGSWMDFVDVLIRDGGYDGLGTYCGATGIRIMDSEVRNNGLGCDSGGSALNGDGVDLVACRNCEVLRTHIHGNNLFAVQVKGGAQNVSVLDSVLESTSQYGVLIGRPGSTAPCPGTTANAEQVVIAGNVMKMTLDNGWPLEVVNVHDINIFNNTITIYDNAAGGSGQSGGFLLLGEDMVAPGTLTIRNNIFDNRGLPLLFDWCRGEFTAGGSLTGCAASFQLSGLQADHNLYFGGGATAPDGAATSLVANPRFVSHPSDLSLQVGSPAINAGVDVGRPFHGAAPDLGAFESPDPGGSSSGSSSSSMSAGSSQATGSSSSSTATSAGSSQAATSAASSDSRASSLASSAASTTSGGGSSAGSSLASASRPSSSASLPLASSGASLASSHNTSQQGSSTSTASGSLGSGTASASASGGGGGEPGACGCNAVSVGPWAWEANLLALLVVLRLRRAGARAGCRPYRPR